MCPSERHITSRLNGNAVPSIFSYGNTPKQLLKRKPPRVRFPPLPKKRERPNTSEVECGPAVGALVTAPVLASTGRTVQMVPRSYLSSVHQRLQKKVLKLLKLKLRKAEYTSQQNIRKTKHSPLDKFKLRSKQRVFLNLQLRSAGLEKVREYSTAEKEYAISLYHTYVIFI